MPPASFHSGLNLRPAITPTTTDTQRPFYYLFTLSWVALWKCDSNKNCHIFSCIFIGISSINRLYEQWKKLYLRERERKWSIEKCHNLSKASSFSYNCSHLINALLLYIYRGYLFPLTIRGDWAKSDLASREPWREHNITLRATPGTGTTSSEGV